MLDTMHKFTSQKVIFIYRKYANLLAGLHSLQAELVRVAYAKETWTIYKYVYVMFTHTFLYFKICTETNNMDVLSYLLIHSYRHKYF